MTAIGTRMKRKEDPKLLTGEAKYVDDIQVAGQLWMGMVRSTVAHARIGEIDMSIAAAMDGVHAVYTGAELQAMGMWGAPVGLPGESRDGRMASTGRGVRRNSAKNGHSVRQSPGLALSCGRHSNHRVG